MKADDLYLPILQILSDGVSRHRRVIIANLKERLALTDQQAEYIDQGQADVVGHVTHRLKRAGLIHRKDAVSTITDRGTIFLNSHPHKITFSMIKSLQVYKNYTPIRRVLPQIILLFFFVFSISACGAKTKQDLIANSTISESFVINEDYQNVYKNINEKVVECMGSGSQYVFKNIYSNKKEAELYMHGVDSSGYAFLAEVKGLEGGKTQVNTYAKVNFGIFPIIAKVVRHGAYALSECPQ